IVLLAMLAAALERGQHFQGLVLRPYRFEKLLCEFERHDVVVFTVYAIERTLNTLCDAGESVVLNLFHACIHIRHAEHPRQLKWRRGELGAARFHDPAAPDP